MDGATHLSTLCTIWHIVLESNQINSQPHTVGQNLPYFYADIVKKSLHEGNYNDVVSSEIIELTIGKFKNVNVD